MFCQNCGTENRDGASFCNSCGALLNQQPNSNQPKLDSPPITIVSAKPPEKKQHGIIYWGAIIIGIIIVLYIVAMFIGFAFWMAGNTQTTDKSKVVVVSTTAQPQISKVSTTLTSSTHCAVLVEGKYITDKIEDEATHATSATFETIGSGKATLTISDDTGKNTYSITYSPLMANDPCQGMYIWRGLSEKNIPASGNFLVIGRAPDKIGMFNDAWGNYDSLEFVRV